MLFRRNDPEPRPPTAWRLGFASGVAAVASLLLLIAYIGSVWVLEQSPEFLQAGLLGDGRSKVPIWLTGPDSVLVTHRDRIDMVDADRR